MANISHLFDGMQPSVLRHHENNLNYIIRILPDMLDNSVKIHQ